MRAALWLLRDHLPEIVAAEAQVPALRAVHACWPEAYRLVVRG